MSTTMQDLLPNSPRYGGSKRVYLETVIPLIVIPLILMVASLSSVITIIVFVALGMILLYMLQVSRRGKRSPFFYIWSLSSGFWLSIVFEIKVIPFLAVTMFENFVLLIILVMQIYFFYKTKQLSNPEHESQHGSNKEYSTIITSDVLHCPVCKIEVRNRYFHTVWLDCCISSANYIYFIAALTLTDITLLYGSNLTITSVCQPYFFWKTILMPEDCSDVYYEFDIAFCFVSAIYALCYAVYITLVLLKNFIWSVASLLNLRSDDDINDSSDEDSTEDESSSSDDSEPEEIEVIPANATERHRRSQSAYILRNFINRNFANNRTE